MDRSVPSPRNDTIRRISGGATLIMALAACGTSTERSPDAGTAGSAAPAGGTTQGGSAPTGGAGSSSGGAEPSGGTGPSQAGTSGSGGASSGGAGASAGGSPGDGGAAGSGQEADFIVHAHFSAAELGPYERSDVAADFGTEPPWDNGLEEGRATIEEEDGNRFLRVTYVGDVYGPANGGVQFVVDLGGDYEELYFAYRVRFEAGFEFNMGGKLPGFGGGTNPTGCQPHEGGFSARNMWRTGGALVQYVYWPDQPNTCGDDLYYEIDGDDVLLTPGSWQTIEHRVRMNTPGQNDGILEAWVDGQLAFSDSARQWRKSDAFAIDIVYFSTFFGGGSQVWASPKEQSADFDDLIVSTTPITH